MKYFVGYIVVINIINLILFGIDKRLAIKGKNRVSERWLLFLSTIGGSVGGLLGMYIFRHKIRKLRFQIWNMFMVVIWGYLVYKYCI